MQKPDFTELDARGRVVWNVARIEYVRFLAEQKNMPAHEIAADIGLAREQAPRIFKICARHDIALTGQGGRRSDEAGLVYRVGVRPENAALLRLLSQRHALYPGKIVEMLVNAALEMGEPFCENLNDLGH